MGYLMNGIKFLLIVLLLIMTGCASSSTSQKSTSEGTEGSEQMTLEDHLRRINGVRISGSGDYAKVELRPRGISNANLGASSSGAKGDYALGDSDKRQPLFVVDGQKVGRDFPNVAEMFSEGEIKSVRLLPESEASQYGSEGGHGVIAIVTHAESDD